MIIKQSMAIDFVRIDPRAILPTRAHGSVGWDIYTLEDVRCYGLHRLRTGIVAIQHHCWSMVALRSSAPKRWGIYMPHGIGIIDPGYSGPTDEIQIQVAADIPADMGSRRSMEIPAGTRLAQLVPMPLVPCSARELDQHPGGASRGGFGSTGGV